MSSGFSAFAQMEHSGWSDAARASHYVSLFAAASDQTIGNLLDAVDARPGPSVLDLCCGQGNVAEALVQRGCRLIGVELSPAMLAFPQQTTAEAVG